MDLVTTNLLNDFKEKYEISSKNDDINFEHFCNYSILKNEFNNEFEYDDISTWNWYQWIDGIAIIVNNQYINWIEELEDIISTTKELNVSFIIIQTKTSTHFDWSQILNFINTTKDFFDIEPNFPQTEEVKNKKSIVGLLYSKVSLMDENPTLKMYYITTGNWEDDVSLKANISNKKELEKLNLFKEVDFNPYGASEIQKAYKNTSKTVSANFTFKELSPFPKIDGVEQSYVGSISFWEFKKIIIDSNWNIKNIFYDNVRDFLWDNTINSKINEDLKEKKFELFPLLNNWVTIVAGNAKTINTRDFFIENYQIVNGCQTSHILFNNKDVVWIDNLYIPIKVIITTDEEIKNQITIATNTQTAIKEEELTAFSDFQKYLESYYESTSSDIQKLHYERRTWQFTAEKSFPKTTIVTIKKQIKTFSSMFLSMPHLASGKYKILFKAQMKNIFQKNHKPISYYISSLALYKIEKFIRSWEIDKKYNKVRLHILMMYNIYNVWETNVSEFNSKKFEKKCESLLKIIIDNGEFLKSIKSILNLIDTSGIDISNQRLLYTENARDIFKNICIKIK